MSDFSKLAEEWAKHQALTEAEAFDYAVKASCINQTFEIDDRYEQAYRQGRRDQEKEDERLIVENAELRDTIRQQAEQISRLREALLRGSEEQWE